MAKFKRNRNVELVLWVISLAACIYITIKEVTNYKEIKHIYKSGIIKNDSTINWTYPVELDTLINNKKIDSVVLANEYAWRTLPWEAIPDSTKMVLITRKNKEVDNLFGYDTSIQDSSSAYIKLERSPDKLEESTYSNIMKEFSSLSIYGFMVAIVANIGIAIRWFLGLIKNRLEIQKLKHEIEILKSQKSNNS